MLGVIGFLALVLLTSAKICPEQSKTDIPRFTDVLGKEDMVRLGMSIAIRCCSEGYDQIKWYRYQNLRWVPYPPVNYSRSDMPNLEENGQVLRIYRATTSDSTFFRCDLMTNGKVAKHHQLELIVQSCDQLARGPIPTVPLPQNKTISKFGENVTLSCTGYFGCETYSETSLVYWRVTENGKNVNVGKRYFHQKFSRNEQAIRGENLTIYDVQPEDLKRTFICSLISSQITSGTHFTPVKIFRKEAPSPRPSILIVIVITCSGFIGLLVIVIPISCLVKANYGPQVTLYVKSRLPRLTPAPKRGEKEINGLLYHADDDTRQADEIRRQLTEKGYDIFMSDDIGGNRSLRVYAEKVKQCMVVMFLYSENLREDNFAHFLLQSLINEDRARDILFLVIDEYVPENLMQSTVAAVDPENLDSLETDGERQADEITKSIKANNDLSFWKTLRRYNVPCETATKRQNDNFICWLQNKIPKFQDQLVKKRRTQPNRRTSSGRRLLDSEGQAELGTSPPNSGNVVGADEVFIIPTTVDETRDNDVQENGMVCIERDKQSEESNGAHTQITGDAQANREAQANRDAQVNVRPELGSHAPALTSSQAIDIESGSRECCNVRPELDSHAPALTSSQAIDIESGPRESCRSERSQSTKLSVRQSSGESGYETTPSDRGHSPGYTNEDVFAKQLSAVKPSIKF